MHWKYISSLGRAARYFQIEAPNDASKGECWQLTICQGIHPYMFQFSLQFPAATVATFTQASGENQLPRNFVDDEVGSLVVENLVGPNHYWNYYHYYFYNIYIYIHVYYTYIYIYIYIIRVYIIYICIGELGFVFGHLRLRYFLRWLLQRVFRRSWGDLRWRKV